MRHEVRSRWTGRLYVTSQLKAGSSSKNAKHAARPRKLERRSKKSKEKAEAKKKDENQNKPEFVCASMRHAFLGLCHQVMNEPRWGVSGTATCSQPKSEPLPASSSACLCRTQAVFAKSVRCSYSVQRTVSSFLCFHIHYCTVYCLLSSSHPPPSHPDPLHLLRRPLAIDIHREQMPNS